MLLYVKEGTELHLKLRNDTDFIPDVVHPYAYLGSKRDAAYHKSKRLHVRLRNIIRAARIALGVEKPQRAAAKYRDFLDE